MLVTQSFGRENEYKRAIVTIISYYAWSKPEHAQRTILFTDNPAYFTDWLKGFTVQYILLTPEKIQSMRGDIDFLHRMKIALIEEAFQISDENLLYADSDTFFVADPYPLMQTLGVKNARMHIQEYPFEVMLKMSGVFREFGEMLRKQTFKRSDGSDLMITLNHNSWNAGVMMLHQTHAKLLPDVYALTHQFYNAVQHHASEQFAFSIILQQALTLQSCDAVVYHYWYRVKKQIMDVLLRDQLTEAWCLLPKDQKKDRIRSLTTRLPSYLENHVLMLRDNAIQAFHEKRYKEGVGFAMRAFLKSPFNLQFNRDLLYHAKKFALRK